MTAIDIFDPCFHTYMLSGCYLLTPDGV